jgi:Terminase small subunit.
MSLAILLPKEEAFYIAVIAQRNPSDAYRTAYQPKRAKAKTIHEMASRLMAKRKVRARIKELM